jgi:hypothetical protein
MEEGVATGSDASHRYNALGDRTPFVSVLFFMGDKLWFVCHIYGCWWWDPLSP